jgi:Zn-dependent protease with chaperone function
MITKLLNHFRLTVRLVKDTRVNLWLKITMIFIPLGYALIPFGFEIPDFLPLIGLLDDSAILVIATFIFNAVCPHVVVQEHLHRINGTSFVKNADIESYRDPQELRDLGIGLLVSIIVLLIGGDSVGLLWMIFLGAGLLAVKISQARLMANSIQCTPAQFPEIYTAFEQAQVNLPFVKTNLFILQNPIMNAYTFGFIEPYNIVLTSALIEKLTPVEVRAVIGHELGHIHFHHVLLINLMGKSSFGIDKLFFNKWSRSSEYSADAIALLASENNPKPMISALLKLASGLSNAPIDLDAFMSQVEHQGKNSQINFAEMLSTHPFIINRITRIIQSSHRSEDISILPQPLVDQNNLA